MSITELYDYFLAASGVSTDTRQLQPGELFFALRGDNFNGNVYAADALAKGAYRVVVDDATIVKGEDYLLVEDVLTTLQDLAQHHRLQFDIPVLALTGSNGKTTTKELLQAVLSRRYTTHTTVGNLNNHIGLPLTLLRMPTGTQLAILEMGASAQGEIAQLCQIAEPTHGLITNIGRAHLEGFGGLDGVRKGKGELFDFLSENGGTAFVNDDMAYLNALAHKVSTVIHYRQHHIPAITTAGYRVASLDTHPAVRLLLPNGPRPPITVTSHLSGTHNFQNLMTAAAVGHHFGVPAQDIAEGLASYQPDNNRSQLVRQPPHIYLMDAYNANPSSTAAALRSFAQWPEKRKIAVLGDMLELGPTELADHAEIRALAIDLSLTEIWTVGQLYGQLEAHPQVLHFDDAIAARDWRASQKLPPTSFLVKGSRGVRMERFLGSKTDEHSAC